MAVPEIQVARLIRVAIRAPTDRPMAAVAVSRMVARHPRRAARHRESAQQPAVVAVSRMVARRTVVVPMAVPEIQVARLIRVAIRAPTDRPMAAVVVSRLVARRPRRAARHRESAQQPALAPAEPTQAGRRVAGTIRPQVGPEVFLPPRLPRQQRPHLRPTQPRRPRIQGHRMTNRRHFRPSTVVAATMP